MGKPEMIRGRIKAALPGTPEEIAAKIDSSVGYVRQRLNDMGRLGEAHVCNARGEPGFSFSQKWAAGPPGPDAPKQPDFGKPRKQQPSREPIGPPGKQVTEATIEKARAQPASWLSALGQ